jgi:sugar-specific transcriptional regulator TrmB
MTATYPRFIKLNSLKKGTWFPRGNFSSFDMGAAGKSLELHIETSEKIKINKAVGPDTMLYEIKSKLLDTKDKTMRTIANINYVDVGKQYHQLNVATQEKIISNTLDVILQPVYDGFTIVDHEFIHLSDYHKSKLIKIFNNLSHILSKSDKKSASCDNFTLEIKENTVSFRCTHSRYNRFKNSVKNDKQFNHLFDLV